MQNTLSQKNGIRKFLRLYFYYETSSTYRNQKNETFWSFDVDINSTKGDEVERFIIMLEEVEKTLAGFEKRCEKTEEKFDEWNCVFIMYTCLRKYCDETKTNYLDLIRDVLKLQSELEEDE